MCGFLHRKFGKRFYQPGTSPRWKCFESRCRQGRATHQRYFRKHTHHRADSLPPSDEPLLRSIESAYSRNFLPMLVGYSCHNLNARVIPTTRIQTKRVPHPSSRLNCVVHHMLLLLQMVYLEWFCRIHRLHWGFLFVKRLQAVWLLLEQEYLLPHHNRTLHTNLLQKQKFHPQNLGKVCDSRHKQFLQFYTIQVLQFASEFPGAIYRHDQAIPCCTVE